MRGLGFDETGGAIGRLIYALAGAALILSQHAAVWLLCAWYQQPFTPDALFWLLPLRRLIGLNAAPVPSVGLFAFALAVAWGLAQLSFRRAGSAVGGFLPAALAVVPGLQWLAVAWLAVAPRRALVAQPARIEAGANLAHILQGLFAGMALIVLATLGSAVGLGSYGWGLFVGTPFVLGVTTAWLANRAALLPMARSDLVVQLAAALGVLALLMVALEGFMCIVLVVPLGSMMAWIGGRLGRMLASRRHRGGQPLFSVAALPLAMLADQAMPSQLVLNTSQSIEIAAPPAVVWQTLLADKPIGPPPGFLAQAGFAWPVSGRMQGQGVGATRLGVFSTGVAQEVVTAWVPERQLTLAVRSQPDMMTEMSPYRHVNAPHLQGYFFTKTMGYQLQPGRAGGTRLTIAATHVLRVEPMLYWAPLARWAIDQNVGRVLASMKRQAEAG